MSRLQTILLLVLTVLAALVVGQAAWAFLAPSLTSGLEALRASAPSVPAWVGWAVLGMVWWLRCAQRGRRCRTSACSCRPFASWSHV